MAEPLDIENHRLLEVENLSKRFGDSAALTDISFSVREKEIVGIIGTKRRWENHIVGMYRGPSSSGLRYDRLAKTSSGPKPAKEILVLPTGWDLTGR